MTAARPARGRRAALTAVLVVTIVAIPVALYLWGRTSDTFAVRQVVITGERRVPRREVRRLLATRYVGENLFTIGAGDVRQSLDRYPYVADVDVDRDFPDTLRVRLTEYEPAALLLSNGTWYVVATDGRLLAQLDVAAPGDGPSPTPSTTPDVSPDAAAAGQPVTGSPAAETPSSAATGATPLPGPSPSAVRVAGLPVPTRSTVPRDLRALPLMSTAENRVTVGARVDDDHVTEALGLLAALPQKISREVAVVRVNETSARTFMRDDLEVEFGAADDLAAKVVALDAVIERYRERRVRPTFIDVSVPSRPLGAPVLPTPAP